MKEKKVLILSVGHNNLNKEKRYFLNNFDGEVWLCNNYFIDALYIKNVTAVGSVHLNVCENALLFKKVNNLNYTVYCKETKNEIKSFTHYTGYSSLNEMINEACIQEYDKIYLLGIILPSDLEKEFKEEKITNFLRQFEQILKKYKSINFYDYNEKIKNPFVDVTEIAQYAEYYNLLNDNNKIDLSKTCFFTILTESFVEMFEIFYDSVLYFNSWCTIDFVILDIDLKESTKIKLQEKYSSIKFIKIKNYDIYKSINLYQAADKLKVTIYKLEAFNIRDYDRVILIDADILCIGDISGLIYEKREGILGCRCYFEKSNSISDQINSGVVLITKEYLNDTTFENLIRSSNKCKTLSLPDQKIINHFFANKIKYLAKKYNIEKRFVFNKNNKYIIPFSDVRLLHFVGAKPNDLYKDEKELKYDNVEKLWRDFKEKRKLNLKDYKVW